jgi:hypothetical protein
VKRKQANRARLKYWERVGVLAGSQPSILARTIWIVDAHRDNGKRFVARADEKLTAFLEPESPIRAVSP